MKAIHKDDESQREATVAKYATVNWATHGHTAAELIHLRADAKQPNAGLTHFASSEPRKADMTVAKNYLSEKELSLLNRLMISNA